MIPVKYRRSFWIIFEMPLINCGISLMLAGSKKLPFSRWHYGNQEPTFAIGDQKFYVPVVTSLTQDNVKLLKQLESAAKKYK